MSEETTQTAGATDQAAATTEAQTAATTMAAQTTATTTAAQTTAAQTTAAGDAKWWQNAKLSDAQRQSLTAMGLTVDDPVEAVAKLTDMEAAAKRRLGKPADQLMDRPGKGQDVGEWLRGHREVFGIPETPDGYELAPPEGWPKDAEWDKGFETEARKIAHEEGLSGKALQRFAGLYAQKVQALVDDAERDLSVANTEMQAALQKDWGGQYAARVTQAQQAASVVAEAAGLDQDAIAGLAAVLRPKVGDAGTIRMFAAIGEMLGEDHAAGLGKGGNTLGTTPADARAELSRLQAQGGDWYEATAKNDRAAIDRLKPKMDQLRKLAAG